MSFAYPNGRLGKDFVPRDAEIVRSLGFASAASTEWGVATTKSDMYSLPRIGSWDTNPDKFLLRLLASYRSWGMATAH